LIKLNNILTEVQNGTLIVVDIQPEYEKSFGFSMNEFIDFLLHSRYEQIYYLYNGKDTLDMSTEGELIEWLLENAGYSDKAESKINDIRFYD
jgi:hypothetical protein